MLFTIGSAIRGLFQGSSQGVAVAPVAVCSPISDWQVGHADVTAADNGGAVVLNPGTEIVDADAHVVDALGLGTTALICLQYTATRTISTAAVLNLFGISAALGTSTPTASLFDPTVAATRHLGIPQRLLTSGGSADWSFDDIAASDLGDGTYKYTDSQQVDLLGNRFLLLGVKTAGALSGAGSLRALVRFM